MEALESRMDDVPLRVIAREDTMETAAKCPRLDFILFSPEMSDDDKLQRYLAEKADVNARPLEWWRQNAEKFPKIAHIARRVLAVPATSVPSESVFSSAGLS